MWFKQAQSFELSSKIPYQADALAEQLAALAFTPCLPSLPVSIGWVAPFGDDEQAPLVHASNGFLMICLQLEEKLLPASVVNQTLEERIKKIAREQERRVGRKEKQSLKEELTFTLLPRAFSKCSKIYAYIDCDQGLLIVDCVNAKKLEQFTSIFKRATQVDLHKPKWKNIAPVLTRWLNGEEASEFDVEKACVLQDPNKTQRVIRCQHQDPASHTIQPLLKDGLQATQLALSWQERLNFKLHHDGFLQAIKFEEAVLSQAKESYSESEAERFDADFLIMTSLFKELFLLLDACFASENSSETKVASPSPLLEPA